MNSDTDDSHIRASSWVRSAPSGYRDLNMCRERESLTPVLAPYSLTSALCVCVQGSALPLKPVARMRR